MKQLNLTTHWQFKQHDLSLDPVAESQSGADWLPASVPGSVHQDLIKAGRIPDPFFAMNETDVQWVGEADWLYRCTFDVPDDVLGAENIDVCFDGLDTFATVWLNGEQVLTSDNMFIPARRTVRELLRANANVLLIHFRSAVQSGKALEAQYGQRRAWNGDTSRLYVRKAQYHYGWDWGPVLLTAGLWRAVRLESYTARISEVSALPEISADLQQAVLPIRASLTDAPANSVLDIRLYNAQGALISDSSLPANTQHVSTTLTIARPNLWYPHGYGHQTRYRLVVTLRRGAAVLDTIEQLIGLRRLRLIQEALVDEPGTSFYFEVNNIPLFCGGANWIPANSFTPRLTAQHYRGWVQLAADANMLMLRVWGGGIYEEDIFYELCDELGLLVWQDFMFACGMYPAHPDFLASVRAEAEANVRRLRQHASIALWCGNNEDYQVAESIGVYDASFTGDFTLSAFPAREIYERLLPEVCAALDPSRTYWPGSPYAGQSVSDQTVGDRHTWDVWHGKMADYREYPSYTGRFVSEFGMQAAPAVRTIESFTRPEEREIASPVLRHHNKAGDGTERLNHYVSANLALPTTLDDYVYATQFIQSEALAAGVEGWRRKWAGPGRYANAGALVWQLNDCWPVTSWAIADYYQNAKPAYYRVRRALAPIALGLESTLGNSTDGTRIWAVNGTTESVDARLDLLVLDFDGARHRQDTVQVLLPALRSIELGQIVHGPQLAGVVNARLIRDGVVIARATRWPEPPKVRAYPDPGLRITSLNGATFTVSAQRPARGVFFSAPGVAAWSDNMIDVVPGDDQTISAQGGDLSQLTMRWYGSKP